MSKHRNNSRQRGAALVIGLILLTIITLLAVVGMNISNSELASATSEQLRLRAFQAAETGVEYGVIEMFKTPAKCKAVRTTAATPIGGSPINSATGLPTDRYQARVSFIDEGTVTEGYSNGYTSFHYNIETIGSSSRNAVARHQQGSYIVNKTDPSFGPLGSDCYIPIAAF
jgi:Tfp pilus assembly protein PilX